jgi:hypothetical protein
MKKEKNEVYYKLIRKVFALFLYSKKLIQLPRKMVKPQVSLLIFFQNIFFSVSQRFNYIFISSFKFKSESFACFIEIELNH